MRARAVDVSVIVPCFARTAADLELLHETLATVERQIHPNYELIVVDDGSPMDVAAAVRRHGRASTLRRANGGSAQARNTGIAAACGGHFVFLDADDHLLPNALSLGLERLAAHPDCGWTVGGREEMTFDGTSVPWQPAQPPPGREVYLPLLRFDWYVIPPSSAMFRRELVAAIGGFRDPWGADDLDFYLRAARASAALCCGSPPVTRYRRYSKSSSRDGERMLRSIRAVYERQRGFVESDAVSQAAFDTGLARLTAIFRDCLVENIADRVRARQWRAALRAATVLARESPARLGTFVRAHAARIGI